MTKEILINKTSKETRLALVEDTVLKQIHIDRGEDQSLVGNIYKAKVLRVMPGMQAAFLDIGTGRSAFMHRDDIHRIGSEDNIADILRAGQDLLVQVVKDPVNKKGALLTTDLSIATQYLVYRHGRTKSGISMQIKEKSERDRLNDLMDSVIAGMDRPETLTGHFILRSAAEGITAAQLNSDSIFLLQLWQSMDAARVNKAPLNLYKEPRIYQRSVRDMLSSGVDRIRVDCADLLRELVSLCNQNTDFQQQILELYSGKKNLFEHYHIEDQINEALKLDVSLNCGGLLVIEETEALSVIDVNTGSFVGAGSDQQTFLEVNLEAATAAARQIRLRNLSGIIIIDFIDMDAVGHRRQVLKRLEQALSEDDVKTMISDFTELGLVQIARKRTSQSLSQLLCEPCGHCEAKGVVKSEETLSYEILRELIKMDINGLWKRIEIYAAAGVIERLQKKYTTQLDQFKARANCDVKLCIESSIPSDQFNIIPS